MPTAFIPPPPFEGLTLGPLNLRMYGLLIATGVLVAMTITRKRYEARGGDPDLADRVSVVAVALAFVGARVAYVLPRVGRFADDPFGVFRVWEGGLALYGGLAVGLLVVVVYLRRKGGDVPAFLDAAAPAVPVAQALGRWGNYFNQELYGYPTDLPWAVEIEPDRRVAGFTDSATFHPTFLYESLWNLALAAFLVWLDRRRVLPRGALAVTYFAGYALARFGLELLRIETTFRFLGISRNGWVSLGAFLTCVAVLVVWTRRRGGQPAVAEPAPEEPEVDATQPA